MRPRIPGTVLVFTYRRLNRFFHALAERVFEGTKLYCSSRRGVEPICLYDEFYRFYRRLSPPHVFLSQEDYVQIITRCRVLRFLPWDRAVHMVDAMYAVIDELTDRVRPEYLLGVMVDCFINDLLVRICRGKGAQVVMLCAGSFPNTILVTAYGEFNHVRTPPSDEIQNAVRQLADDAGVMTYGRRVRPYSLATHLQNFATWWAKCAYFRAAARVSKDPLNFWYLLRTMPCVDGHSCLANYRCWRYFEPDWRSRILRADRPTLFIPLSHTPEASTDYWLRDLRYVAYEAFILDAVKTLSKSFQLVIKEHWSVLGQRDWRWYEQLKSSSDAVLVPPEVPSRQVMGLVDHVMVGAGTTGPEAAIRGKKVVTLDRPYYYLDGYYLDLQSADNLPHLPRLLAAFRPPPATPDNQAEIVERMLQATLVGSLIPDSFLNSEENVDAASASLRRYLDKQGKSRSQAA